MSLCRIAYQALFLEGGLKKGQNVLIHAVRMLCLSISWTDGNQGASGVGVAAIQLACESVPFFGSMHLTWFSVRVGGAGKVFTTCGTDDKVEFLKKFGHSDRLHVVNYKTQSKLTKSPPANANHA